VSASCRGAFTEAITKDDVRALFNHDENFVLGRNKSGTLRLAEDETGLKYEIDPPDTSYARDLLTVVGRGDVDASSFAFRVIEDMWEYFEQDDPDEATRTPPLRTIKKCELFDVSPVTYPAYPTTSVSARAKERAMARTVETTPAHRDDDADDDSESAAKALVGVAHRDAVTAYNSCRKAMIALGITGMPSDDELGDIVDGRSGRPGRARRSEDGSSVEYFRAGHAMRHAVASAVHAASHLKHLVDSGDGDGTNDGGGDGGDDAAAGSDAGANAAILDTELRAAQLAIEIERLR
jgi:HK97 family phage prohead protease